MEKIKMQMNSIAGRIIVGVALAVGIYLVFQYLLPLVVPFAIAGIVSILYYPVLRRICKRMGMWDGKKKKVDFSFCCTAVLFRNIFVDWPLGGYLFGQCQSIILNFPFYEAKAVYLIKCQPLSDR